MTQYYRLYWQAKPDGEIQHGTVLFEKSKIDDIVKEANQRLPYVHHWAEPFIEKEGENVREI